jgi:ABC-type multidrug transport system ATPase subunit
MQLFALVANAYPQVLIKNVKDFITTFILKEYDTEVIDENLRLLENYYTGYSESLAVTVGGDDFRTIIELLLNDIDFKVSARHKFLIIIRLLLFERFLLKYAPVHDSKKVGINEIIDLLVQIFKINQTELDNCRGFIAGKLYNIANRNCLLIMGQSKQFNSLLINFAQNKNLQGQLFFLYVESVNMILFLYQGKQSIMLNYSAIYSNQVYLFNKGYIIHGDNIEPIYYNQILRIYLTKITSKLALQINEVEFFFKNSKNGLHSLSAKIETGQLTGIMGRSGVGKSTLLNLLNGRLKPDKGSVFINFCNVYNNPAQLNGIIGYIPQDDLLVEELTVYTNLYINAQLCFDNLLPAELDEKVKNLLLELNLYEVKDLKVGNPLKKYISGGQRKKLNMALELIRNPWVLFVDEPTSGLSSSDSDEIMQLLSDQTLTGRIVVVNIHQPSSDTFKMLDKIIIIDAEGYPVYWGNPLESITWFNKHAQRHTLVTDYCHVCENVNPESIFKALEEKTVDEFGQTTHTRKKSAKQWHQHFKTINTPITDIVSDPLPNTGLKQPNVFKQFLIFGKRNLLAKLANRQYMVLALLISPALAFILSFLCKWGTNNSYIYAHNDNIPSFLFMSVIVSLFVGMVISAEEIIKDRKILFRESFLKLSIISYVHSKLTYLVLLSAFQSALYVYISCYILQINFFGWYFWLVMFSTAVVANLIGLLISGIFNSVIVIYIMVPLIMVPQILLSGVVVNYKKINKLVATNLYTPVVGDLIISRWAYEALTVTIFKDNPFQKHFYETDSKLSNCKFNYLFVIPELQNNIKKELSSISNSNPDNSQLIHNELTKLLAQYPTDIIKSDEFQNLNTATLRKIDKYITRLSLYLQNEFEQLSSQRERLEHNLKLQKGVGVGYNNFVNSSINFAISDIMLNRKDMTPYLIEENNIARQIEPVYHHTSSKVGRSHFYAGVKYIANYSINTSWFNIAILWFIAFILYGFLLYFSYIYIRTN